MPSDPDCNRNNVEHIIAEDRARQVVPGILDRHRRVTFFQQVSHEVQAILETGADDDLIRLTDDATRTFQVLLNVAA